MRVSRLLQLVAVLAVVPFGVHRISHAMASDERRIVSMIHAVASAMEAGEFRDAYEALGRGFRDEGTGASRRDVARGLGLRHGRPERDRRSVLSNFGADGVRVVRGPEVVDGESRATVALRVSLSVVEDATPEAWWDLECELEVAEREGRWVILASRNVNHDDRRDL